MKIFTKLIYITILILSSFGQTTQDYMNAIKLPEAWNITEGSSSVILVILGGGVEISHPALAPSISSIPGYNFVNK